MDAHLRQSNKEKRAARPAGKKPKDDDKPRNLRDLQERGLLPKWLWLVVYSLINLVIFAEAFDRWGGIVTDFNAMGIADKPNGDLSMWTPWAKAFGQVLNFNCSMIIVPILRNLLLWVTKVRSLARDKMLSRLLLLTHSPPLYLLHTRSSTPSTSRSSLRARRRRCTATRR